jgi:hypothetical protein
MQNNTTLSHVIQLKLEPRGMIVHPQTQGDFEPFQMPQIRQAMVLHCGMTSDRFYQRTGRCMAFVLALNVQQRDWQMMVPQQRCGPDSACWTLQPSDIPPALPLRIAGSFQMLTGHFDPSHPELPNHDGLHLIQHRIGTIHTLRCYLCTGGEYTHAHSELVIRDEVEAMLQEAKGRMEGG